MLGWGQRDWRLLGFRLRWLLKDGVTVEARGAVLRLEHFVGRLLGVDDGLVLELALLAEKVQGLVPVDRVLELVRGDAGRDHEVVGVPGSHHGLVLCLAMGHAPIDFAIMVVDLELAAVHELVLPWVRLQRLMLLSVLPQLVHFVATTIILAVGA